MHRLLKLIIAIACVTLASAALADAGAVPLRVQVERAAVEAARATVAAPDRFEVENVRFSGADAVDRPVTLQLQRTDGPSHSGRVRVYLSMLDESGLPAGTAQAVVQGERRGPALVATRMLRSGQPIAADAVKLTDVDLTRLSGAPLRKLSATERLGPLRSLGAGRALTDALLAPLPVVHRNQPIDLVIRRGSLTVRTKGRVRRDAAPGETVVAENLRTGAEVLGRVQADGSVLVVRGAVQGRAR